VSNNDTDGNLAGSKLVLIVEDHPPAREVLSSLLASEGYRVIEASNGREALELVDAGPELPCVIVLDLVMPVMDGREFLKARAQDPTLSRVPVVVLSSNVQDGQTMDWVEACLRKPTSPDSLLRLLRRLC
jgi:CheY-like chemotaxis protein